MPHSDYLLALAQIAIAFGALSTIAVVLRQSLGGALASFQTLTGFSPEGLPVGIQIVGRYRDDLGVL